MLPAVAVDVGEVPMDVFATPVSAVVPFNSGLPWSNPAIGDLSRPKRAALVPGVTPGS